MPASVSIRPNDSEEQAVILTRASALPASLSVSSEASRSARFNMIF